MFSEGSQMQDTEMTSISNPTASSGMAPSHGPGTGSSLSTWHWPSRSVPMDIKLIARSRTSSCKIPNHAGWRRQLSSIKNGQASTSCLRHLHSVLRTARTFETTRAVAYKRETFRMSRVLKMFRKAGSASPTPTKASYDDYAYI